MELTLARVTLAAPSSLRTPSLWSVLCPGATDAPLLDTPVSTPKCPTSSTGSKPSPLKFLPEPILYEVKAVKTFLTVDLIKNIKQTPPMIAEV